MRKNLMQRITTLVVSQKAEPSGTTCLLLSGLLAAGLFFTAASASAYQVKVHNPTNEHVHVYVSVNKLLFNDPVHDFDVRAHSTGTIETGALCPSGVGGYVYNGNSGAPNMQSHSCLGHDVDRSSFTACCWNLNFKVCRKRGDTSPGVIIRDGDYGFCLE